MKFLLLLLLCSLSFTLFAADFQRMDDEQIKALRNQDAPVLINFWATWCQACQAEIPAFNRFSKEYSKVKFIGINVDDRENRGAIKGFLKKHPIDYEIFLRDGKSFEQLALSFQEDWKAGLPATFIYQNGKKVFGKLGAVEETELEDALRKIQ